MSNDPATGKTSEHFDRIGAEATESLRGDARRVHALQLLPARRGVKRLV